MMGLRIPGYPLLALLAVAQFAAPARSTALDNAPVAPTTRPACPPPPRIGNDRARASTPATDAAIDRERSVALLLLLDDAAAHWRLK